MKKLMGAFRDYGRTAKKVILHHPVHGVLRKDVCVTVSLWLNEICTRRHYRQYVELKRVRATVENTKI